MRRKNNFYILSVLIIWFLFSAFEIVSMVFLWPKPVYWRAWEGASNYTGKDQANAPFKPLYRYDSVALGDLLNVANLKPLPSEIKKQVFQVDEYGFRNDIGMLNHPIDAVILGSSFVAGAAETQEKLVSSLLTKRYKIPTYNGALYILQNYMEDERFLKNPPKYLIMLGSEGEFISAPYRYTVENRNILNKPKKWNSFEEWEKNNDPFKFTYTNVAQYLNNFSMTRYLVNNANVEFTNLGRGREEVVKRSTQQISAYDNGMLFFQPDYDDPLLGSTGKTEKDIDIAIVTLEKAREMLAQKGTTLIVAAMPSKVNLEYSKYKKTPRKKRAIVAFEKRLDNSNIEHVNLFEPTFSYMKKARNHLYYFDDSHWNNKTNELIAKLLSEKINQLKEAEAFEE